MSQFSEQELQSSYEFTLDLKMIPVKLHNPEHNDTRWYVIREMDADRRDKYFDRIGNRLEVKSDGTSRVKKFSGTQSDLLTLCMYEAEVDDSADEPQVTHVGKIVDLKTVLKLPARVQERLFEIAQRLSGLDDQAEERAKNE